MYVKIEITGEIELATGMHIGGSASFSAIGAIDSPVIRDVESDLPMIPGSSLKGKLRTLLAKNIMMDFRNRIMKMRKTSSGCLAAQKRKR